MVGAVWLFAAFRQQDLRLRLEAVEEKVSAAHSKLAASAVLAERLVRLHNGGGAAPAGVALG
jgi:hypothetical protein